MKTRSEIMMRRREGEKGRAKRRVRERMRERMRGRRRKGDAGWFRIHTIFDRI